MIRRMAYFAVLKTKGSYTLLCFAILAVGWIASLMTSCNAHMIMIIIAVGICNTLGFEKFDLRAAGLFLAVALGTISSEQWQYYPSPMSVLGPALLQGGPLCRNTLDRQYPLLLAHGGLQRPLSAFCHKMPHSQKRTV